MTIRELIKNYEAIGYFDGFVVFACRCCGTQMRSDLSIEDWKSKGDDDKIAINFL